MKKPFNFKSLAQDDMVRMLILIFYIVSISACSKYKVYNINHIIHMGQSLGAGEQALPIVTDSTTGFGNLKFKMGTHTWSGGYYPTEPHLRSRDHFNFIPLTANRRHAEGETIGNGLCDHFTDNSNFQGKLLFSYAGRGNRYLRDLDKRHDEADDLRTGSRKSKGGHYKTSIHDVIMAKQIADSLDLSYNVMAITWMQGETNNNYRISAWDDPWPREEFLHNYKNDLIQLKKDYDSDISKILGRKLNIPFFTYQTGGTKSGTAQLMATEENSNMYMVGPTYMMPNAENTFYKHGGNIQHGDGIHITADAERWLGEQFGKVIKRVQIDKENWQPLIPKRAYLSNNKYEVNIEFHVPRPPLVLDTLFLPNQGKTCGFNIYDENNNNLDIKAIEKLDGQTIKITLDKKANREIYVSYATNSYVKDVLEPIHKIFDSGRNNHGHDEIAIEFDGNLLEEFSILINEGVFYLENITNNPLESTSLIIREIKLNKSGNTVLMGEKDDLKNGVSFQIGQECFLSRRFKYGNLRDSDNEQSTFKFKDTSYGRRGNMYYPLYNWCIAFQDLEVSNN